MFRIQHRGKYIFSAIFLIILSLLCFNPAVAEDSVHSTVNESVEGAGGVEGNGDDGHSGDRSGDLLDLLYRFMNFALLVIILSIVIKKTKLTDYLSVRSEEIRDRLEDLKKEKEEAENRCREVENKLKDFESKKKEIIEQYTKEGQAEKDKIVSEAKERVKQIIEESELTIREEIQSAKDSLKEEVVELAAQKAQEIITSEMDEKDQDNLINEFIERVGKIN
ncbi:ATP synthase F0 subunit B [Deltaproteobacteria bacterium]|nr:ATP synthase F0 subunit B [Deltaproteobacteria bacterium]